MLLVVVSTSVTAEWTGVGINEQSTVYADLTTIRKSGNLVKMWSLHDYKTTQGMTLNTPYKSSKLRSEFDCKEGQSRQLYMSMHLKNMGIGDTIWVEDKPRNWVTIIPGSIIEALWKLACKANG